jgi:hypothetical protein
MIRDISRTRYRLSCEVECCVLTRIVKSCIIQRIDSSLSSNRALARVQQSRRKRKIHPSFTLIDLLSLYLQRRESRAFVSSFTGSFGIGKVALARTIVPRFLSSWFCRIYRIFHSRFYARGALSTFVVAVMILMRFPRGNFLSPAEDTTRDFRKLVL